MSMSQMTDGNVINECKLHSRCGLLLPSDTGSGQVCVRSADEHPKGFKKEAESS
jgi:hypothetical protein